MRWEWLLVALVACGAKEDEKCRTHADCQRGLLCADDDSTCQRPLTIDERDAKAVQAKEAERAAKLRKDAKDELARRQKEADALRKRLKDANDEARRGRKPTCDPKDPLCADF